MSDLRQLIISAFCLVMGFLFLILGCTVVEKRNAWPLMSLVLYCFTPVPFVLCGRGADSDEFGGDDDEPLDAFKTIGLFIGGVLLMSGPGLALVLYHTSVICGSALLLTLLSGVCFLGATVSLTVTTTHEDDADDGYNF
ncbi:putative Vacuolar protein sorting 55 [Leishmania naiffi]|uniref:Vacuolar protein sorting 55 n=1 Tax=Leishmania naiffi TaxID=5678 RepID=A0AAW3BRP7_9TRYP